MDVDAVLQRHDAMVSRRSNWDHLWERVAELVLPRCDDFTQKHAPGQRRNLRQFDAFPMAALSKFSAATEAGLIPRSSMWHRMSTGDEDLDDEQDIKVFFEAFNDMLWRSRYSPRANFAGQAHEKLTSLGAFGTGCMLVEARPRGGIRYRNIHLSEIYAAENAEGWIDTVHRKFTLTARQAVQEFGKDTPQRILDKYNTGKHHECFEFIHVVQPSEDWEPGRLDVLPFESCYILEEGKETCREDTHYENPYIVSRYSVSSREVYGRSPAIQLLPDISMLNEMKYVTIEAANMSVDPPTLLHHDISEFDLTPGAQNMGTVDDNGRPMAVPFDNRSQPGITRELMADTRNQIDDGFLGVYFRVLLENPNMTATQAMLIAQQQGQMTAPVIGRLQAEWLAPMIRRESGILYRQGRHPPMPDRLKDYIEQSGEPLQIEYETPMTRAAKSEEAIGILRAFETLTPFAQIDPQVFRRFKMDEVADIVADVNGVPARALKSDDDLEAENEQQAAQQQLGEVLEAAPIAANTAKTLVEAQKIAQSSPQVPAE